MISLKVLSTVAAMALIVPMVTPSASFADPHGKGGSQGASRGGGGGGSGMRMGGSPGMRMGGSPGMRMGGGASGPRMNASPGVRMGSAGGASGQRYSGNYNRGGNWNNGGNWHGGHRRGGGYFPGVVAGAVIGGALASSSYGSYGSYGYYGDPGYYDQGYYDDGAVAVAPDTGGDDVGYCMQTYRSYDPRSGTYLGYDGLRHPCP